MTRNGQLWTEDGPWSSDTVTNTYNNRMRTALSLGQPTGVWTNTFGFDAARRLTNVTSPAGAFDYTLGALAAASPLTKKILLPNTSYITNTYDAVARLTGTWLKNSTNGTLDSATYGYNAGHQRTTFTNAAGTYVLYTYDPIGQLKVANSSVNSEDRGYKYDAAWNLNYRTNNGALKTFTVNSLNEVTAVGSAAYAYDANGNRTSIREDLPLYEYDDENQLILMESAEGWRTEFTYDGTGRLRQRVEYTGSIGDWTLESTTRYVYDGKRVIQERDGSNVPTVSYTRGTDLSGSFEGAGGIGGLLGRSHGYSSGNWTNHNFYHADGNGNVTYLANSSQTVAASYRYDPFGNTISSSGTLAAANVYRFSSKEIHVNSGMYYYGYRFYDPNTQSWPNRDPLEEEGGFNLYAMVFNDPVNAFDAFGLQGKQGKPKPPKWDPKGGPPWGGKEENNCCNYAYDQPGPPYRRWPGQAGGEPDFPGKKGGVTCDEILRRIKVDFPNNPNVGPPQGGKCPSGTHNTKAWIDADGVGWHMQRQDDDGKWSEKPDALTKPQRCNPKKTPDGYKTGCPEICVPDAARY